MHQSPLEVSLNLRALGLDHRASGSGHPVWTPGNYMPNKIGDDPDAPGPRTTL